MDTFKVMTIRLTKFLPGYVVGEGVEGAAVAVILTEERILVFKTARSI